MVRPGLNIELWDFREIIREIGAKSSEKNAYFTNDTMRKLRLFAKAFMEDN